ncbi:MAG: fused MFS/spermidine synthase [Ferrovibrio sp.]|uniref:fused MFS/spermidine synthase n=1 Tax=Ferrovibrio sp. TaxID=1917215 RepID=UPI002614B750|nr:fused MFS/spermidine synthase [Ferrovibrio sp.]MCW0233348.1 fused MFS/spermidine synthase [Ferrovibrio sp.]
MRTRQAGYGLTLFLTSAGALIVEIVAGRMLAPHVGMSLYTWTAIIAVVLAGLSVGHWIGGLLAAPHVSHRRALRGVALALLLAGLTAAGAAPLLGILAGLLGGESTAPLLLIVLLAAGVFLLPSLFVGVVSPVLTKLAIDDAPDRQGPIIGRMFALGAAGSILGTLSAGYLFISWIGSTGTMLAVAGLYLIFAVLFWQGSRAIAAAAILTVIAGSFGLSRLPAFAAPCAAESDYYCIRIVDFAPQSGRPSAAMVLDHLAHSINDRDDPTLLYSPYLHFVSERSERLLGQRSPQAYFIGGGAFTLPRAWAARYPDASLTVAEIDPAVTHMATQAMWLDPAAPGLQIRHADARRLLASLPAQPTFDLVLGDAFHDYAIPAHLVTREFHRIILQRLAPNGAYAINVIDQSENPRFTFSLVKTMQRDFPAVEVWLDDDSRRRGGRVTFVVLGLREASESAALRVSQPFRRIWLRWPQDDLDARITAANVPVLTDDFAPVDRLMAGFVLRPDEALR